MRNIQQVVNDKRWQALRRSLVGTWKNTPEQNVNRLRAYLGPVRDPKHPRFRRVYNYLTGSGFRIGVISHPSIDKFLAEIRAMAKPRR